MLKSCKKHRAGLILSKLPIEELEYLGVALNDIVHVENLHSPDLVKIGNIKVPHY